MPGPGIIEFTKPLGVHVQQLAEVARMASHPMEEALKLFFPGVQTFQLFTLDVATVEQHLDLIDPSECYVLRGVCGFHATDSPK